MRVLVAGGAGLIGSHLCERLLARGDEVRCVDSLVTSSATNVEHLRGEAGFQLVTVDVTDGVDAPLPLDAVMHLASPASPSDFVPLAMQILEAGSVGTRNLLRLARDHGARFLLASTSEVYGDPLVHPQPESYHGNVNPVGIRAVYDEAKRFGEAMTMAYHRKYALPVRIARIFNTYGPRMRRDDGRIVSNFVIQAIEGRPLTVYGDGSQTRSFCYVDDEVDGLIALLDSDLASPVNIGNPREVTAVDLAETVRRVVGSRSEIVFRELPADDPRRRCPDITLAREQLGWEPSIGLEEGLARTAAHFQGGRTRVG